MALSRKQWAARIPGRKALELAAKNRHRQAQAALTRARTIDQHPRGQLVTARDAASALLVRRRQQVLEARDGAAGRGSERVSARGAAFIAAFEGGASRDGKFRPYQDPVGVWTIGFGHTLGVSAASKPLTHKQAVELLLADLNRVYTPAVVSRLRTVHYQATQHELDALVSFVYNLGPGVLMRGRTAGNLLARLAGGSPSDTRRRAFADSLLQYDKAGSPPRALPGLTRRRRAERRLFLTGEYV